MNPFVNKDGPGSEVLRAARITGPGLPPAGLVLTRPHPSIITNQAWLNIRREDGLTDPASATFAGDVGNIFRMQRTQGIAGAAAATVVANPISVNRANPTDCPGAPATGFIDFTQLGPFNKYTFEIFYDGEVSPRHAFEVRTLTPIVPATNVLGLRWLELTTATLGYLDPADPLAAATPTMNIGWIANPLVETVRSRGATSATATAPGGAMFPALTDDGTSSRNIQLRYRSLDGGFKDSATRFD